MINVKRKLIGILFGILVIFLAHNALAASRQLLFAYQNTSNFPFATGEGNEIIPEKPGIAVELIMLTAKKLNIEITLKRLPWKRGLTSLKDGEIDGLFNSSFKSTRVEFGCYPMKEGRVDKTKKSYSNTYVLYKMKGSSVAWNGKTVDNLKQAVGVPSGFSIADDLRKIGVKIEEAKSTTINLKKLLKGRIDGVAALESAADFILETNKKEFANIVKIPLALKSKEYYLMLSHQFVENNPQLAEDIWRTIALHRESIEFNKLKAKYYE